jgi:general stress protein 26
LTAARHLRNSPYNGILVMMDERILKFLKRHRISVLTTVLKNGQPHSATIHYAYNKDTNSFYFLTAVDSRKMEDLVNPDWHNAALVIGFSEEEWLTMQLEGKVRWISDKQELEEAWKVYSGKFNGSEKEKGSTDSALLEFSPKWWRYTEVRPNPQLIISSNNNDAA